jgi:zinc protease
VETPDKESAVFMAGLPIDLRDDAKDYPALVLGNFMTGGGFLNSRLAKRIRQQEGISYGVGSFFYASAFENDAYFGSYAIYAPQNAELLVRAYKEEIARVLESGFAPDEVAEAKQGWLQQRTVSRSSERELARTLASREYEGRTLAFDEKLERAVEALTPEQIVAAMKRFLDPARISTVQAGDFAKAGKLAEAEAQDPAPAAVR